MTPTPVDLFGPRGSALRDIDSQYWSRSVRLLQLAREIASPQRDEWGNWDGQFLQDGTDLSVPILDDALLGRWTPGAWPDDRPFSFLATFDIDTLRPSSLREYWVRIQRSPASHVPRLARGALRNLTRQNDGAWDFDAWLRPLRAAGFRSTWFAFPDALEAPSVFDGAFRWHDPAAWQPGETMPFSEALKRCVREGHEVGLHGSYHSATRAGYLAAERRAAEQTLGTSITSIRQHYLHFDSSVTPGLQQAAGLQTDSSVGMNRHLGFRSGTSYPHFLWDHKTGRPTTVLEVPLVAQDGPLVRNSDGSRPTFASAFQRLCRLMDEVERTGGCYTILFHPDGQDKPLRYDLYCAIVEEAARRRAWGPTLSQLRARWLQTPNAAA